MYLIIGQSDKVLLTVLEERESLDPNEPNYVLTRLGPMASGGRVHACSDLVQSRRTAVETCHCNVHKCGELKEEMLL